MRYRVRIHDSFPAAHRIRIDERGTREPVHVHHWRLAAVVQCAEEPRRSAARALAALRRWTARYRGRSLNDICPFDAVNPTAEEVAREAYLALSGALPDLWILEVTVGEAAGFSARYLPPTARGSLRISASR